MDTGFQPSVGENDGDSIAGYLQVVSRRKWWLVAASLVSFSLAVIYTVKMVPEYRAEAVVRIGRGAVESNILRELSLPEEGNNEFFRTQCEILTSKTILDRVAENLARDSVGWPEVDIAGSVKVTPVPNTFLVKIACESQDAEHAARVANLVPHCYLEWQKAQQSSSSKETLRWLQDETQNLRTKSEDVYSAMEKQRESVGTAASEEVLAIQREEATRKYIQARLKRVTLENRYQCLRDLLKSKGEHTALPPEFLNAQITELQQKRQAKSIELQEAEHAYKPKHPRIIELKVELEQLDQGIAAAVQNRAEELKAAYDFALAEEQTLEKHLRSIEEGLAATGERTRALSKMERETENLQQLYDILLKKTKETEIVERNAMPIFTVIDQAVAPTEPFKPRYPSMLAMALVVSLLIGLGVAFLVESLDASISSHERVTTVLHQACLGEIPLVANLNGSVRLSFDTCDIAVNEAFKSIDTNLRLLSTPSRKIKRILITSSLPKAGKTFVAANLAAKMAQNGPRVVLIDTDFYRRSVSDALGVGTGPGLAQVLTDDIDVKEALSSPDGNGFSVLSSGNAVLSSSVLSYKNRIGEVLAQLELQFDILLIDAPPSTVTTDVAAIASETDGVVFVTHAQRTNRSLIAQRIDGLKQQGVVVLGVVLNFVKKSAVSHYYRYYHSEGGTGT